MTAPVYHRRLISEGNLKELLLLAKQEEARFFTANPHLIDPYRDRLLAICLCQGAAWHYTGVGRGVKDFDIHFFYRQNPKKPRLSRTVKRIWATVEGFPGDMPVDFVRTVVPLIDDQQSIARSIQGFLTDGPTANARELSKKAVVGLHPKRLFGKVIWPC
jgi:hypothetical protein